MTDRQPCCIPFCRRTFKRDGSTETMCGKHWRMTPRPLRARHSRIKRLWKKAIMRGDLDKQDQALTLSWALWGRLKILATEAAAGIG